MGVVVDIISLAGVGLIIAGLALLVVPGLTWIGLLSIVGVGLTGAVAGFLVGGLLDLGLFSVVPELAIAGGLVYLAGVAAARGFTKADEVGRLSHGPRRTILGAHGRLVQACLGGWASRSQFAGAIPQRLPELVTADPRTSERASACSCTTLSAGRLTDISAITGLPA